LIRGSFERRDRHISDACEDLDVPVSDTVAGPVYVDAEKAYLDWLYGQLRPNHPEDRALIRAVNKQKDDTPTPRRDQLRERP
jgi:isochorismate hydrolase